MTGTRSRESLWERFAQTDPQLYIDPTVGRGVTVDEFIVSGRALVDQQLRWAGELAAYDRALEIGCGIGRSTVHLSRAFNYVDGVDVAPTMIQYARDRGLPENVRLHVTSGRDLSLFDVRSFDFIFSHLVFQHVQEDATIENYFREIARVLRPAGVALLQFDTRRSSILAAAGHKLPDPALPGRYRRGMRRYRRSAEQIRRFGAEAGLALDGERGADTAGHWFRWRQS